MAITSSTTTDELHALRDAAIKALKAIEGELLTRNPGVALLADLNSKIEALLAAVVTNDAASGDVAVVSDAYALEGVAPSGSYTDTVTFTVTNGAISAIVLS